MQATWLLAALAVAAGAAVAVQAGVNATLGRHLASSTLAALVSFGVGTLGLALVVVATRVRIPASDALAAAPWWAWVGGLLGAFFIATSVLVAPRLGAAALVALVVAGQLTASLLLDHHGLVGFAERPATALRLLGAGFLVVGVALIRAF